MLNNIIYYCVKRKYAYSSEYFIIKRIDMVMEYVFHFYGQKAELCIYRNFYVKCTRRSTGLCYNSVRRKVKGDVQWNSSEPKKVLYAIWTELYITETGFCPESRNL